MASDEGLVGLPSGEATKELTLQWRRLIRTATAVAVLTSPVAFIWFTEQVGLRWGWALFWTFIAVIAFRGLMDIVLRRLIPWPSLFGTDEPRAREEDIVNRRRAWYWAKWFRRAIWVLGIVTLIWFVKLLIPGGDDSWVGIVTSAWDGFTSLMSNPQVLVYAIIFPLLFVMNFLILLGPMLALGITQMQGFEPGDAEWGVKLDDVRGQAEAKEEVRRVVSIWQSGEAFEAAGGKRERGMLFLGAPGTGKTMLSKAIATGFNCPFVSMPGSGFAQTFIGLDVVIVRYLAWKAKRLARKWGGQCIVFIDEIDAVGRRRSTLGGEGLGGFSRPVSFEDFAFHGRYGSLTPSGDLILENRAWREKLFAARAPERPQTALQRFGAIVNQAFPGGMMGGMGQLALNQLLVVMDGIDNPPFMRKVFTNRVNTFLDATYIIPRRIGNRSFRLPPPRPRQEQIYFIGATNVPLEALDPALTRPGRMGRYVWLRTPTKKDRLDIFDLYLGKVAHDPELDTEKRRDEIARITNGYAQPLDANVLTPVGWKRMGDLEVGDDVIGGNGKPTTVVGVHPRGEMDVYRVRLNDGTSTRCTADHLWSVDALDPRMLRRTFTLAELMDRELRWSRNGSAFYVPNLPAVEFSAPEELPIDPYLLGYMLGDGGLSSGDDETSVARVAELVPAGVSRIQHGPRAIGLSGRTSQTRFIPEAYKRSSVEERLSLLRGLLDTDGSVDYRRRTGTEFYTASKRLADDVAEVVRSLGGLARVKPKREGWRVAIELLDDQTPFRQRITAVEPVGRQEVQCITVANDDGLYVTDDYIVTHNSPAMIEQVCSMALTYAHHEGSVSFGWEHIVEAMTTIESGMAINIDYVPEETRAVAIHEAGHAVAGHVYMKGAESTRLSIRRRGEALGHHQALEKEERFSSWRSEEMARLIWTLGAMAAERVFYGENSTGVGGDVQSATARSAWMVGACAMAPERIEFADGFKPQKGKTEDDAREEIAKRYERIGIQIMNRSGGGSILQHDPLAGVLGDPAKRAMAAQLLGQAYVTAHQLIEHNKAGVEKVADVLVDRRELHGDEILGLLESAKLEIPPFDPMKEESWPKL